jgi:hypothetical protein
VQLDFIRERIDEVKLVRLLIWLGRDEAQRRNSPTDDPDRERREGGRVDPAAQGEQVVPVRVELALEIVQEQLAKDARALRTAD